jgi:hypothetical protein
MDGNKIMNFYHDGSLGDIIYSLPTVKAMGGGDYYIMKRPHYGPMRDLLNSLPYINSTNYGPWPINGGIDLRFYRKIAIETIRKGETKHLADCHAQVCNVNIDRENPWIERIEPLLMGDIVVNRSLRYHDIMDIDYGLLRDCKNITFIGRVEEYRIFKEMYNIVCWQHECKNVLEMARIIAGARLFVGNQSLGFALAEAMKVPRVLEVCAVKDNCRPAGENGYTELNQEIIRRYLGDN